MSKSFKITQVIARIGRSSGRSLLARLLSQRKINCRRQQLAQRILTHKMLWRQLALGKRCFPLLQDSLAETLQTKDNQATSTMRSPRRRLYKIISVAGRFHLRVEEVLSFQILFPPKSISRINGRKVSRKRGSSCICWQSVSSTRS